jgi:hypothetical protein
MLAKPDRASRDSRRIAYVLDDEPQIAASVRHALTAHG